MNFNLIYDYQIFLKQKYGGPSRYFVELNRCINSQIFNNEIVAPFHINRHLKDTSFNKEFFSFIRNLISIMCLKNIINIGRLKKYKIQKI